jgi:hypothetical protein
VGWHAEGGSTATRSRFGGAGDGHRTSVGSGAIHLVGDHLRAVDTDNFADGGDHAVVVSVARTMWTTK